MLCFLVRTELMYSVRAKQMQSRSHLVILGRLHSMACSIDIHHIECLEPNLVRLHLGFPAISPEEYFEAILEVSTGQAQSAPCMGAWGCNHLTRGQFTCLS